MIHHTFQLNRMNFGTESEIVPKGQTFSFDREMIYANKFDLMLNFYGTHFKSTFLRSIMAEYCLSDNLSYLSLTPAQLDDILLILAKSMEYVIDVRSEIGRELSISTITHLMNEIVTYQEKERKRLARLGVNIYVPSQRQLKCQINTAQRPYRDIAKNGMSVYFRQAINHKFNRLGQMAINNEMANALSIILNHPDIITGRTLVATIVRDQL